MSEDFKIGDTFKVLRKPDDSIYRIVRIDLRINGPNPTVTIDMIGWDNEDKCDIGVGGHQFTMSLEIDGTPAMIAGLEAALLPFIVQKSPYFADAHPGQKVATIECAVCGVAMSNDQEIFDHRSHQCSECGTAWNEEHGGGVRCDNGTPVPTIRDE